MVTIIAAIAKNNALGNNNGLIWHLPADLKRFKKITLGHHIIMGRNTFESIGKPLPNRTTVILTKDKNYFIKNCLVASSIEKAIGLAKNDSNIFIVGGAQVYKEAIEKNLVDILEITFIDYEFDADVFFPKINLKVWKEVKRETFLPDENSNYKYSFVTYKKK